MLGKINSKSKFKKFVFGFVFALMGIASTLATPFLAEPVYAEPVTEATTVETTDTPADSSEGTTGAASITGASCEESLGALGWLVCPTTGKISEAVDWLYEKIEDILVINPVQAEDGQPIYEIWKYFRGVTNIVFIIFLLVVIYSQITGVGISNYGVKRALPKLIVAAVLVNLSFIICSLAVDVSNVIGNGLRGLFESIEATTMANMAIDTSSSHVAMAEMYSAMAGGTALAIGGGLIAFETGAIWMLIPVALGAVVAVASGLITIALRQAVVALLIMIAPLAIVAYILPNTEQWFRKWKQLLTRMLVFYPAFSLLFGASSLAGWAIIVSSSDGFGILLGTAVQIFPLFFSWKLMKMSGTFLETVNSGIRRLASGPLATNRAWAESHREFTKQKNLASGNVYTPTLRLRQFLANRRISREEGIKEYSETVKNRGLAYNATRNYKDGNLDGVLSRRGRRSYEAQARNMRYHGTLLRHNNNMNKGFGQRATEGSLEHLRLNSLDMQNVVASDLLKAEQARGERIEYENAVGFHQRMEAAINAHMDNIHGELRDKEGKLIYKGHFDNQAEFKSALERYGDLQKVMEGNLQDVQYVAATAAQAYDTQAKIIMTKFQKYFELTPPTQDVMYRLREISLDKKAIENIDSVITGMRILNQRGDTDLVKDILDDLLKEGVTLGTHASQSLASFLMFEVKDGDPWLRRFGKYINLETARIYNRNDRQETTVTYDEYVKGYHEEPDGKIMYAKRGMEQLMAGTPLDGIERTALDNYDSSLRKVYTDENGELDVDAYLAKRKAVDSAMAPQFISANLKFLSGSEAIVSAVKAKTGFISKQNKETGEYEMIPIWESQKDLEELLGRKLTAEEMAEAGKPIKDWYREQTMQYLRDQTPAQIIGLRSDYHKALIAHLSDEYLLDPENKAKHDELIEQILKMYSDPKEQEAEIAKLKNKEAGEAMRELLFLKGKLDQIEKTKRSGAANNAKDWVRELLLLDADSDLKAWIIERRNKGNRNGDRGTDGSAGGDALTNGGGGPKNGGGPKGGNSGGSSGGGGRTSGGGRAPSSGGAVRSSGSNGGAKGSESGKSEFAAKKKVDEENEQKMLKEVEEQEKKKQEADAVEEEVTRQGDIYTAEDMAGFVNYIEDLWYSIHSDGGDDEYDRFFEESFDYICNELGKDSYIARAYEKYYEDLNSGESYDLREYLTKLLEKPENY